MKRSVMIARFPFGRHDEPDVTNWLLRLAPVLAADERISKVIHKEFDDTPITMTRNRCVEVAKALKVDVLVMVDNDMKPDAYLSTNPDRLYAEPQAKPFWQTAFDHLCDHHGPCMIGAPYCGPPPQEVVYVFRWATWQSDNPNPDHRLEMFPREDAEWRAGTERVGALPTGLCMIDMRAFDKMVPPYFKYEWSDQYEQRKASTEDVFFSREISLLGTKLYTTWDCWAGHWKRKCVGKPRAINVDRITPQYIEAIKRDRHAGEKLTIVENGVPVEG